MREIKVSGKAPWAGIFLEIGTDLNVKPDPL